MDIWVGIEVTRQVRVADGKLQAAGELAVGDVNLLEHQIGVAKQIAPADNICVLSPQGDEKLLEIVGRHGVREIAPYDFVAMLAERANRGEDGAVVLLRQIAPLQDATDVKVAIEELQKHPVIISGSRPPKGVWTGQRHPDPVPEQAEEDYRCLAFEARRVSEFSREAMAGPAEEKIHMIPWGSFAEYTRREDLPSVYNRIQSWIR